MHPLLVGLSWVAQYVLASNMSGIYALQAMGEDEEDAPAYPEALAEVVIDRMAAANVARFRHRRGLQVDTDFAYAFASWAEARDAGGHAIADAWSELRMDFEDAEVLGKAASAAEGAGLVAAKSASVAW